MVTVRLPSFRPPNTAPIVGPGQISVPNMEKDEYHHYTSFIDDSLNGSDSTEAISGYLDTSDPEDMDDLCDLYDLYDNSESQPTKFTSVWDDVEFGQYLYQVMGMYLELTSDDSGDDEYESEREYDSDSDEEDGNFSQDMDTFDELERILPPSDSNTFGSFVLEPRREVLDAAIALGDCNFTTSRVNAHYLRWLLYGDDNDAMEYGQYEEVNYNQIDDEEVDCDEESEYEFGKNKDIDNWLYILCAEIKANLAK